MFVNEKIGNELAEAVEKLPVAIERLDDVLSDRDRPI